MKVIIPAIGSQGDISPLLGFGKAILDRGESVVVISSGNFRSAIEDLGLQYVEACDAPTYDALSDALIAARNGQKKMTQSQKEAIDLFVRLVPKKLYELVEANHDPGSTVLASPAVLTMGLGSLVQEKLDIPYVAIRHLPALFKGAAPWFPRPIAGLQDWIMNRLFGMLWLSRKLAKSYMDFRTELGLDQNKSFAQAWFRSEQFNACLFPAWFVPWYRYNLPNTIITNFPLYELGQNDPLPPHMEDFLNRGEPPVLFMRASWEKDATSYFKSSMDACTKLGVRGVFLTKDRLPVNSSDDQQFCFSDYASLKLLLPRTAAIVHHAGLGTIARSLAEARPQLAVYSRNMTDVTYNARQLERLGVGMKIPFKKYVENSEPLLRKLLANDSFKQAASRVSNQLVENPNFGSVIGGMKQLVESRADRISAGELGRGRSNAWS